MSENVNYIPRQIMDFIEFLVYKEGNPINTVNMNEHEESNYSLVLPKASSIILVEAGTHEYSYVHTDKGKIFKVVGNYRTVTNRVFYANQAHKIINMSILKPSDYFYHRTEEMNDYVDNIYFSQEFMDKLKNIINSELFTYRGINNID